ncbi:MAG: SDR family oxidoreductase [Dehalococcoidia bacterium]|nr:SDR family oxidoreductase [Dehalococcoidia bacterium]
MKIKMFMEQFRLDGKVALVTGGSRGVGRAVALAFAEAGADVVIAARKVPDLESTAAEIEKLGRKALPVSAHMGRKEDRERLIDTVAGEFGHIDVLVNNAATNTHYGPAMDISEESWDKIVEANLKGQLFLTQAVVKLMRQHGKGGTIVNVASDGGFRPYPNIGIYGVTKAGLIMLTKVLAQELGKDNIRVNAVAPGWLQTGFSRIVWEDPDTLGDILGHTTTGRLGQAEDVAGAVLLLASDASHHISGQTIIIDGGYFI